MKHVKLFEQYSQQQTLILYHGTPYKFEEEKFRGHTIFLSNTRRFAEQYAEIKAVDFKLENGITVYKCEVNANIFDIHNLEHRNRLLEVLPIYVKGISKEEYVNALRGIEVEEGFDMNLIKGKTPGNSFRYDAGREQTLVDIDDDFVYYIYVEDMYSLWERSGIKDKTEFIASIKNNALVSKASRHDKEVSTESTWRYFETQKVEDGIQGLGFDGYMATERNIVTYAIFNLDTIKILGKI